MSMNVRREVKGQYHISKHRRYELEHFVRQYDDWVEEYGFLDGYSQDSNSWSRICGYAELSNTEYVAERRLELRHKMNMVMHTAYSLDDVLGKYIFRAVIKNKSYTEMQMIYSIPCGRDKYYELIRKFYWELDKRRK